MPNQISLADDAHIKMKNLSSALNAANAARHSIYSINSGSRICRVYWSSVLNAARHSKHSTNAALMLPLLVALKNRCCFVT